MNGRRAEWMTGEMDECRLRRDRGNAQEISKKLLGNFLFLLFHNEMTMKEMVRLQRKSEFSFCSLTRGFASFFFSRKKES